MLEAERRPDAMPAISRASRLGGVEEQEKTMALIGSVTANEIGGIFTSGAFSAPVTACFGLTDEVHTNPHAGTDLGADAGTAIPCLAAGRVVFTSRAETGGWSDIFGNSCIVDHGDGTRALYAHMAEPPARAPGDEVAVGDTLGLIGNTGYSFGAHLHLGLSTDANPWFNKDTDGGVSRLLDPLDGLAAAAPVTPAIPPLPVEAPDAYTLAAHQAGYLSESNGRLRRMFEARVPKFVITDEIATMRRLEDALVAAADAIP